MTNQPTQEAPSSDVVAFLHKGPDGLEELTPYNFGAGHLTEADKAAGWTEIPLYAALASTAGDTLKAENERLREALQWYAKEYNWRSSSVYMCGHSGASAAEVDRGNKARTALGSDQ